MPGHQRLFPLGRVQEGQGQDRRHGHDLRRPEIFSRKRGSRKSRRMRNRSGQDGMFRGRAEIRSRKNHGNPGNYLRLSKLFLWPRSLRTIVVVMMLAGLRPVKF